MVLAASSAFAAPATEPTPTLDKRATTISCDSFGSLTTGGFTIYHNNWGAADATSGSQCTYFNSLSSGSVAWSTSWTWAGGAGKVKSYSNVALENVNKQLSAISSIPSTWKWSQTGSSVVADVAYDLWLSSTSGGSNAYEIMIWLGAYGGAGPISATGSAIATTTIGGVSYKLYYGLNGSVKVYSFVATTTVTSFSADLKLFFTYLTSNQGVPTSYYVTSLQAGTEPFSGSNAVLTTSAYTISVK
ncbi:xyloglucan-specific endo-beta-1,4-glucanase A [Truncatella angustata]|uniref:Xyloglucan-specific endo-beta-1,4-glucanase A n=1 Tax=Truncatella angustata TaxID=152316 RepID=A0A9P8US61_9PEZI|nr:xyloglucan-specific endo-beta-1,4-glucanase A [Truncatella angustata]KAH6657211.1 xyloglucan-specific endo-beta-1,4-glucanase A [Truncatella angustata]